VGDQGHTLVRVPPEKKTPVSILQEAGWAQDRYKNKMNFKGILI
jgi:hypothetical protein